MNRSKSKSVGPNENWENTALSTTGNWSLQGGSQLLHLIFRMKYNVKLPAAVTSPDQYSKVGTTKNSESCTEPA